MHKLIWGLVMTLTLLVTDVRAQELSGPQVEVHKDWSLRCLDSDGRYTCQMIQELSSSQSGERVVAFVIDKQKDSTDFAGTFILPFGLQLNAGVSVQVDGKLVFRAVPFSTCLPAGCLAPVDLTDAALQKLKAGRHLELSIKSMASQQLIPIEMSLAGFSAAFKRLSAPSQAS